MNSSGTTTQLLANMTGSASTSPHAVNTHRDHYKILHATQQTAPISAVAVRAAHPRTDAP